MKVVVDKLPNNASECIFSEYFDDGDFNCKLDNLDLCSLCLGKRCDKLLKLKDIVLKGRE